MDRKRIARRIILRYEQADICRALSEVERWLQEKLRAWFLPSHGDASSSSVFAVYAIQTRIKDPQSLRRKLLLEVSDQGIADLDEMLGTLERLGGMSTPEGRSAFIEGLSRVVKDLVGARIVVLSQRHKFVIRRALELQEQLYSFAQRPPKEVFVRMTPAKYKWKYYNPPSPHLVSAPYFLSATQSKIDEILETVTAQEPNWDKKQVYKDLDTLRSQLCEHNVHLKRTPSGYSTLQRFFTLSYEAYGDTGVVPTFCFLTHVEIQIRTVLEDAWAEPEHRISYKGRSTETIHQLLGAYGAMLFAADDLFQQIVDNWQEHNFEAPRVTLQNTVDYPVSEKWVASQFAPLKDDKITRIAVENLKYFYRYRAQGLYALARRFLNELNQLATKHQLIALTTVLKEEEAFTLLLYWELGSNLDGALGEYSKMCSDSAASDSRFLGYFRRSAAHRYKAENSPKPVEELACAVADARQAFDLFKDKSILRALRRFTLVDETSVVAMQVDVHLWLATILLQHYREAGGHSGVLEECIELCKSALRLLKRHSSGKEARGRSSKLQHLTNRSANIVAYAYYQMAAHGDGSVHAEEAHADLAWTWCKTLSGPVLDQVLRLFDGPSGIKASACDPAKLNLPAADVMTLKYVDTILSVALLRAKLAGSDEESVGLYEVLWKIRKGIEDRLIAIAAQGFAFEMSFFKRNGNALKAADETISKLRARI